jgi:hypothetical protein
MQHVGSMENTNGKQGARPPDGESRVSNPLDTVSLLEIGLYLCVTFRRFQGLTGAFQIHILLS